MPCLVGCLAIGFPRIALLLVWLLGGGYIGSAYPHWVWPVLGFVFLPLTTLTFAFALHHVGGDGVVTPFGWILIVLAGLIDIGSLGGGGHSSVRYARVRGKTRL